MEGSEEAEVAVREGLEEAEVVEAGPVKEVEDMGMTAGMMSPTR